MDVTVVVVNFNTPDLLSTTITSFCAIYPEVPVLIVDNGSEDESIKLVKQLENDHPNVSSHLLDENIFHGPAMDLAIRTLVNTRYVFFLDSDTETVKGGFLEEMIAFADADPDKIYGVGSVVRVNKRGFKDPEGMPVLLTPYMMLRTHAYSQFPPFLHHGQPTIQNLKAARASGWKLQNYNIEDYIHHHWRGTADRFGYGLGLKGKIDYLLNKLGL